MRGELSFWAAVGLVAIAAVALLKIFAGTSAGSKVPGLRELAAFI